MIDKVIKFSWVITTTITSITDASGTKRAILLKVWACIFGGNLIETGKKIVNIILGKHIWVTRSLDKCGQ